MRVTQGPEADSVSLTSHPFVLYPQQKSAARVAGALRRAYSGTRQLYFAPPQYSQDLCQFTKIENLKNFKNVNELSLRSV